MADLGNIEPMSDHDAQECATEFCGCAKYQPLLPLILEQRRPGLNSKFQQCQTFVLATLFSSIVPGATAQDLVAADCDFDQGEQKPGAAFPFTSWLNRGRCIRDSNYAQCRSNLATTLEAIDPIHQVEYGASAGVLALLPTIGALFGTTTSEIWTLLTILPCGGFLAMLLSFGGTSAVSTRLADYESALAGQSIRFGKRTKVSLKSEMFSDGSNISNNEDDIKEAEIKAQEDQIALLFKLIRSRLNQRTKSSVPTKFLALGLVGMVLMLCAVQIAMAIIEVGAVYSNGCNYVWWFHIWYICVTLAAYLDSWAQLPFKRNWKFYLTSIPQDVQVIKGHQISKALELKREPFNKILRKAKLGHLKIIPASDTTDKPKHSVMVMVSTTFNMVKRSFWRSAFQVFTKAASVTVFVFSTCVLSAVSLLAMPMAQLVLMSVVGAGVGSRVLAGAIVSAIGKREPMIHVITENNNEALHVIREIFALQDKEEKPFQIETRGHVFVKNQRVAKRNILPRAIFGVMVKPFDLAKVREVVASGDDESWEGEEGERLRDVETQ